MGVIKSKKIIENDSQANIVEILEKSLMQTNITDIGLNVSELFMEQFLKNNLFKDIPIIKIMINTINLGSSISDFLFVKKLMVFLNEIESVPIEVREKEIKKLRKSNRYTIRVGEKILYLLDKCNDHRNSLLLGRLFKKYIEREISYNEYIRCAEITAKLTSEDIEILNNITANNQVDLREVGSLFGSGLFELEFDSGNIVNGYEKIEQLDAGLVYTLSDSGKIIKSILYE